MGRLTGRRVVVAGAGAVGAVLALRLRDDGAEVLLADPAPPGANASGVAAGMLAPAFEAALDPVSVGHFELLRAARDLWPELAGRVGSGLDHSGALWIGDETSNAAVLARLAGLGAAAEAMGAPVAERISAGLMAPGGAVFTSEDWTLDPMAMLAGIRRTFEARGGEMRTAAVRSFSSDSVEFSDGAAAPADVLVLAAGLAATGFESPPAELAALQPIKGQLVSLASQAPREGPVVRGEGIYLVPRATGPIAGATMEPGVRDLSVDPDAVERLRAAACRLHPALARAPATGAAGVRAATPDGLPLVGESRTPGVWLAMGARRNGWLLAPLIAEALADQLAGGDGGPWARPFAPDRFLPHPLPGR